ncbi:MAG: TRAP transporter large permease [Rhodospirillaceae bacterium]|nr:TRAP transporter large permease [Rhodospirillaceae bacterium]MYH38522.1 TRAP transporter large permease [Rhodospirillaceae bacterium]MYK14151.1 TRAP transporter large permease [Rhodospirillaceae bacterium]
MPLRGPARRLRPGAGLSDRPPVAVLVRPAVEGCRVSLSLGLFLASFLFLLFAGLPVAWTMVAASLLWLVASGQTAFLPVLPERIFQGIDVFVLMAIPLFILAGELINESRITDRLIAFANVLFGWMRGGLAQVNIGASILFSGITGVALGDIAALGKVFIPSMSRSGYSAAYAAAVTASSSIIGPMVPPSLIVVIYGSMTGISIGALFAACIVPGLTIGLCQMTLVGFQARRRGHAAVAMDRSLPAVARSAGRALPPLMIPGIILAGILGGIMTPTEAGGLAAFYALLIAVFLYRTLGLRQFLSVLDRSAVFSAQLLIIVGCGAIFTWVMGMENVPALLENTVRELALPPALLLIALNLIMLLLGMFIDPVAAIILFVPILATAATAAGVDPVHFGAIAILNLNIGLLTPPLGVCLFAAERIAGCGLPALLRETWPFLLVSLAALVLVTYVPGLSLWLPRLLGF